MTVLLYDRIDLEERASKGYRLWKGCHITSYALAAIFGLLNFYFLFLTMRIFGDQCVLNPHELVFNNSTPTLMPTGNAVTAPPPEPYNETVEIVNVTAVNETLLSNAETGPPLMLDLAESQFHMESYCDMALYTPLLSTIFGMVWGALFIMCPAGGRSNSGLSEPWRILAPALLFAFVFVVFIGHNFFTTNSGLHQLCAHFFNVTNTTTCTRGMDAHMPVSEVWMSASVAVGLTRAACAGAWACWAAACALLLARSVAGADFTVNHTEVRLHADPSKKLTPLLKVGNVNIDENDLNSTGSPNLSRVGDADADPASTTVTGDYSLSEPTTTSELNTASYAPALNNGRNDFDERRGQEKELIELSYSPSERP